MEEKLVDITYDEDSFYAKGRHFTINLDGVTDMQIKRTYGDPDEITFILMDGTGVAVKGYEIAKEIDLKKFYQEQQRTLNAQWQDAELIEE